MAKNNSDTAYRKFDIDALDEGRYILDNTTGKYNSFLNVSVYY